MDIDLDHAGIGRDLQHVQPRIRRRGVTFDAHRQAGLSRGRLGLGDEIQIVFQRLHRRDEDGQVIAPGLDGQGGAHRAFDDHLFGAAGFFGSGRRGQF